MAEGKMSRIIICPCCGEGWDDDFFNELKSDAEELVEALEFYNNLTLLECPEDWNSFKMGSPPAFDDYMEVDDTHIQELITKWREKYGGK